MDAPSRRHRRVVRACTVCVTLACSAQPAVGDGGSDAGVDADATIDAGPPFLGNLPPAAWGETLMIPNVQPYGVAVRDDAHILVGVGNEVSSAATAQLVDLDPAGALVATHALCTMQGFRAFAASGSGATLTASFLTGTYYALSYCGSGIDGGVAFQKQLGGTSGSDFGNWPAALAFAADGSAYLSAPFNGTVDFGTGTLSGTLALAKLDPTGMAVWANSWPADQSELAIDGAGNVVLGAASAKSADFGGGPLNGYVLADLAPDGGHVWSHTTPTQVYALASAPAGFVAVVGASSSIDGVATQPGGGDIDVAAFDATGKVVWAKRIASALATSTPIHLVAGRDGTVVLSRDCEGTMDFGNGPITVAHGCCIANFNASSGSLVHGGAIAGCETGFATSTVNGDLVVAGYALAQLDLGNGVVLPYDANHLTFAALLH